MKKTVIIIIALAAYYNALAQDITGSWNGILKVQGMQLKIVFHIKKTDSLYSASMDSPDQGAKGIVVSKITFTEPDLFMQISQAGIQYKRKCGSDSIKGVFQQGGMLLPLNLSKKEAVKTVKAKPQEPKKPYPYDNEEIVFKNTAAGIQLAGTLSLPKKGGRFGAVVLITGSGSQNRDEELMGHEPFLVVADYCHVLK